MPHGAAGAVRDGDAVPLLVPCPRARRCLSELWRAAGAAAAPCWVQPMGALWLWNLSVPQCHSLLHVSQISSIFKKNFVLIAHSKCNILIS